MLGLAKGRVDGGGARATASTPSLVTCVVSQPEFVTALLLGPRHNGRDTTGDGFLVGSVEEVQSRVAPF